MQWGFDRCSIYDSEFDGYSGFILVHRRVDVEVASWWSEQVEKEIYIFLFGRISRNFCMPASCPLA
jgi:hypothetical protein